MVGFLKRVKEDLWWAGYRTYDRIGSFFYALWLKLTVREDYFLVICDEDCDCDEELDCIDWE